MNRRLTISLLALLISTMFVLLLWKHTLLLSLVLLLIAGLKFKLMPIEKELLWFVLISVTSGIAEILLVNISGAWQYTAKSILNVPLYMPIYWGIIASSAISIYGVLIKKDL